ncbi:hypothetical protein [Streptosporangium canum]|uniref:hypothetical protein n=1 Tax=Streptosporangium canum TaxID=324952 RepID=UPI0037A6E82B
MNNSIAYELNHKSTFDSERIQHLELTQALKLARRLAAELYRAITPALSREMDHVRDLVRDLIFSLDLDIALAFMLADKIDITLEKIFDLDPTHDRNLCGERNFARARARYLLHQVSFAHDLARKLTIPVAQREEIHQESTADLREAPINVTVTPLAGELIDLAMRVLPPVHRKRYVEELRAELWDLAAAKATRSMQVLYAVQQLRRVWQLRRELKAPDRSRAELLHQAACWVLASQVRTWGLIGFLTIAALFDVVVQQGPGSAFFAVPTLVGLHSGVEWLRKRWAVEIRGRKKSEHG